MKYGELEGPGVTAEYRERATQESTPPVVAEVERFVALLHDLTKARIRLTERLAHVTAQRPTAVLDSADKRPNDALSETGQALTRSNDELADEIRHLADLTNALEV